MSPIIKEKNLSNFEGFQPYARILYRGGIKNVDDLITSTPEKIRKIRDIGEKKFASICQVMQEHGLNFI